MNNTHSNPIPLDKKVPTMEGKGFSDRSLFQGSSNTMDACEITNLDEYQPPKSIKNLG
jgi:hypothetical protein